MTEWTDGYWWSNDGLRLHYRDYAGPGDRPAIICLHGLTRNARDFEPLIAHLARRRRIYALDMRGRGASAYAADPMSYVPLTYAQDVEAFLIDRNISRYFAFGTSMGGIVTMLLASTRSARLAGVLLNDVGPVITPEGLTRIKGYVGRSVNWPTWLHAAQAMRENNARAYPDWRLEDWIAMAKRLCKLTPAGRIAYDYDMRIAEPLRVPGGEAGFDMWSAYAGLSGVPATLLRGALSDVLSEATAREMVRRKPDLDYVTVARVGHAPLLDELESLAAIDRLLARGRVG